MRQVKTLSILYLFPHSIAETLAEVEAGSAPSERMYGLMELRKHGYRVDICDSRFAGAYGRLSGKLRPYGIFLLDWNAVREIARHDVVIVKDEFSLLTSLITKMLGKELIYFDAMFNVPKRWWRRMLVKWSILASDACIAYSEAQIDQWSQRLGLSRSRFTYVPYTMDVNFYRPVQPRANETPYVFAVGRDLGRDFGTLIEAVRGTGLQLKLLTLPYTLPPGARQETFVEVLERVSYPELFGLYANAAMVVVPLKNAIFYPSGIRAALEAALLGKAAIVTYTPILEHYLTGEKEVIYVPPGDAAAMRTAIKSLLDDVPKRNALEAAARTRALSCYGMEMLAQGLIQQIEATGRHAHSVRP
jgi:glycosyltransferase involved in cell wall biosynthesis